VKRKIIEIDPAKCDGCGQCIDACHEGALALVDGKARLVRDIFCDGLGACIGECPQGALTISEREAPAFDAAAVEAAQRSAAPAPSLPVLHASQASEAPAPSPRPHARGGCPGSALRALSSSSPAAPQDGSAQPGDPPPSSLGHWPVQLALVPPHAPFLAGADLLVCADCVPFAVPDFHARYLSGRAVVVGCPKLDDLNGYAEKLRQMVAVAQPRRLTVLRMEVPCCRGLAQAAIGAALESGLDLPVEEHVVGVRGGVQRRLVLAGGEAADPNQPYPGVT
jgi:NAD-dependent dihydropyrimidine dehydrogenase PreA subunit